MLKRFPWKLISLLNGAKSSERWLALLPTENNQLRASGFLLSGKAGLTGACADTGALSLGTVTLIRLIKDSEGCLLLYAGLT